MKTGNVVSMIAVAIFFNAQATGTKISLEFDSLPSQQGWTYRTTGPLEADIFSVDGTRLYQNSLGTGLGPGGTAFHYYAQDNVVHPTAPFVIEVRARFRRSEMLDYPGFNVGAQTGAEGFELSLTEGQIWVNGILVSSGIDTAIEHLYRLEATPRVGYRLFVGGSLEAQGLPQPLVTPNQLYFGDATSGGNAQADINFYEFQGVPEPSSVLLVGSALNGLLVLVRKLDRSAVSVS